jgi:hypothetical protein
VTASSRTSALKDQLVGLIERGGHLPFRAVGKHLEILPHKPLRARRSIWSLPTSLFKKPTKSQAPIERVECV